MLLDHVVGHRPAPGDHDDLGPLRPQHGLHRLRGSAGAEHKGLFAGCDAAAPLQKQAEAVGVRVRAVQRAVRPGGRACSRCRSALPWARAPRRTARRRVYRGWSRSARPTPRRAGSPPAPPAGPRTGHRNTRRAWRGSPGNSCGAGARPAGRSAGSRRGRGCFPASRGSRRAGPRTRPAIPGCRAGAASSASRARISCSRSGCRTGRPCSCFTAAMRAATSIRRRYRAASCASSASISCRRSFKASISVPPVRRPAPRPQLQPLRRAQPSGRCRDRAARAAPA